MRGFYLLLPLCVHAVQKAEEAPRKTFTSFGFQELTWQVLQKILVRFVDGVHYLCILLGNYMTTRERKTGYTDHLYHLMYVHYTS